MLNSGFPGLTEIVTMMAADPDNEKKEPRFELPDKEKPHGVYARLIGWLDRMTTRIIDKVTHRELTWIVTIIVAAIVFCWWLSSQVPK